MTHSKEYQDAMLVDHYSWYDIACAMLVLGLGVAVIDVLIVVGWEVMAIV